MAEDKPPKDDPLMDDPELRANMGSYFSNATRVGVEQFQPQRPPQPKNPSQPKFEERGGTGKGTPPPFPVVPNAELTNYQEIKQTDTDTFGMNQSGKFDPELNELALKEVAQERGMTVEQLLSSQADRESLVKLQSAKTEQGTQMNQQPPSSFATPDEDEVASLEERLAQAKMRQQAKQQEEQQATPRNAADIATKLAEKEKRRRKKKEDKEREEQKLGIPKEMHDNPVILKLRQKLGLDDMEPAKMTIEGVEFEMLPPPASLNLWILQKIQAGAEVSGDGAPLALTIKIATVSAAIVRIEGEKIENLLGIPSETADENDALTNRMLAAQSLWEMFLGLPSRAELFRLHPEVPVKLYDCYKAKFANHNLQTDFKGTMHRYVCPIDDCSEMYDMDEPMSGVPPFCKVHGIPTEDKGLVEELRSVPLA